MFEGFRSGLANMLAPTKNAGPTDAEIDAMYRLLLHRTPPQMGTQQLISAYKRVPEFRAVIGKIADHVAAVSWRLYVVRKGGEGKAKRVRTGNICCAKDRRKELAKFKQDGDLVEIVDHPLAMLLDEANPMMSGFTARRLQQVFLDIVGESFAVLSRNAFGVPTSMWPIPPHWIASGPEQHRDYFEVRFRGNTVYVAPEDMVWTRDADPIDPYGRGSGIGTALADELDTSDFAAKYVKAFFYNRGKPDMIVGIEGANKEQAERAQQEMENNHRGYSKAHRTWWTSGKLHVKELNSKFQDMQVVELKGAIRDNFVNTYGIPPEILGILGSSNRATIREALKMFVSETIAPRLERSRDEGQRKLVPLYDERLILDYDDPTPVDPTERLAIYKANSAAPTRGEWRELQGLDHRGEVDDVHLMLNTTTLVTPETLSPLTTEPTPEPTPPEPPESRSKVLSAEQDAAIDNVLEALRPERLSYETDPLWKTEVEVWGESQLAELGLSQSFDMLNPLVVDHLNDFSTMRIQGLVDETTRAALRAELVAGVEAGESAREISNRVRTVFDVARKSRADAIARTEVQRSANFADWSAGKQSGLDLLKQWLDTPDGRTRGSHAELGATDPIPLDEPFVYGGAEAMHPGDFGVASLDINCRCGTAMMSKVSEPKTVEQALALWKLFDQKLMPWESQAVAALIRGFDIQQREVILAIGRELNRSFAGVCL